MSSVEAAYPTLLNVGDNVMMRYAKSRVLAQAGYHVLEAGTGEEALALAASRQPNLIVLDVNLPGIDGLEVCRRIKQDRDTAHITVLHVTADERYKVACLEGGGDACLIEPIDPSELVATVRALLRLSDGQAENQRLLEQLRHSERQFSEATEAADCGMWDWNIRTGKLEWFGAHERLAGIEPGSFSGKVETFIDILHPDDRTRVWERLQHLMAQREECFTDEYRFVHPDGTVHWMSATGRFFYDEAGQARRMTGVVQDITARKQAEEQLQRQAEGGQLLARAAEQLLTSDDPAALMTGVFETVRRHLKLDSYFLYRVNSACSAFVPQACGGLPDELMSRFQQADIDRALCGATTSLVTPVIRERLQVSSDDESEAAKALGFHAYACHPLIVGEQLLGRLAFASNTRDQFEPEELTFIQTICRYVAAALNRLWSEHDRAEGVLAQARLAAIVDSSDDAIISKDLSGTIQSWNAGAERLFGYTAGEMIGSNVARLIPLYRRYEEEAILARIAQGERVAPYEAVRSRKDGSLVHVSLTVSPVKDAAGRVIGASKSARDITDRIRSADRLARIHESLTLAQQASQSGVWDMDLETDVTYVSREYRQLYGLSPDEPVTYDRWLTLIHPEDRARVEESGRAFFESGTTYNVQFRVQHPALGLRWIEGKGTLTRDASGRPLRFSGINVDITERHRAEDALRESGERLLAALRGAGAGTFRWDLGTGELDWDEELDRLFGLLPGQTVRSLDAFIGMVHPDERADVVERCRRCAQEGADLDMEFRVVRPDGSVRWVSDKGKTVFDDAGQPLYVTGACIDITERAAAQKALADSEAKYRYMFESAGVALFEEDWSGVQSLFDRLRAEEVTDLRTHLTAHPETVRTAMALVRLLDVNEYGLRLFHAPEKEMLLRSLEHICVEATSEVFKEELIALWEGRDLSEWPAPLQTVDGHELSVLFTLTVPKHDPEWRRVLVAVTDVTPLQRTESELRLREEQLRIITDSVPSFISYVDDRQRYRFVNAAYERMFGARRQDIIGQPLSEVLGPAYETVRPYVERALAGETVQFESNLNYVGTPTTVLASYTPDLREDGHVAGFYVLVTDITEQKRQESDLRQWKDELEVHVAERTRALVASQNRLRELASQLNLTEQRERRKLARDLHDYLAQLLVVGRMKMSQMKKLPMLPVKAQTVAEDIDDMLQQSLTYTRTMIADLCPPSLHESGLPAALVWLGERMHRDGLWVEVHSDRHELPLPEDRAVLVFYSVRELLFNVLKHASVDRATVRLSVDEAGDLRVTVEDRGKGLDASALARASEPGHLGLFAVRERMEASGGHIEVSSAPGEGTVVTMVLPRSVQES
jgi:PAS domain S-box-containing protein